MCWQNRGGSEMKKFHLNYVRHRNIKHGGHGVYSNPEDEKVVIKTKTEQGAIEQAKKEWARLTSERVADTAVVFDSFVQVVDWKPKKKEVHLYDAAS
jgi:hypothetical protein